MLQAEELKSQLTVAVQGQKEAKDKMLLCLADMENLRARSAQQVETNRKFAVQVCIQRTGEGIVILKHSMVTLFEKCVDDSQFRRVADIIKSGHAHSLCIVTGRLYTVLAWCLRIKTCSTVTSTHGYTVK